MRLFEAIVDANHRAIAGDAKAGVHVADFENELPVIALTCVDPRLNALFPNVLGLPGEEFIWLRNAGNIITGPLSSTMRSLALACAVKGGKEIAIIGHTDCQVGKTTTMQLLEKLEALGVKRHLLPENLNEFFGMFGSDRQNVIKACDFVRGSPLIGPKIPVHGLLADIETGKLEWLVNGYNTLPTVTSTSTAYLPQLSGLGDVGKFDIGEMKFPETKIGDWASAKVGEIKEATQEEIQSIQPAVQRTGTTAQKIVDKYWPKGAEPAWPVPPALPKIPSPPTIRPHKGWKR